jgi:4-hydroxyphenylpyruvate dioxygenase
MELHLPAIKGIGGAPLYLIDRFEDGKSIYDIDFDFIEGVDRHPVGHGLKHRRPHDAQRVPRAAWRTGRASTRRCSISARSATSTSRANTPA